MRIAAMARRSVLISLLVIPVCSMGVVVPFAWAWDSDGHMRLATLTVEEQPDELRCFDQFILGSDEPDAKRQFWNAISHQEDADVRSVNAFCASARLFRQAALSDDQNAQCVSAQHLGHAFHYLQDMGDPSKLVASDDTKQGVREVANYLLSDLIAARNRGDQSSPFWTYLTYAQEHLFPGAGFPEMHSQLRNTQQYYATEFDTILTEYQAGRLSPEDTAARRDDALFRTFAVAVAAQRRTMELFQEEAVSTSGILCADQ